MDVPARLGAGPEDRDALRVRVATAETAAVRISVMGAAFMIASSSPSSPSCRRTPPMCVSSPRDGLVGTMTISFSAYAFLGAAR